MRTSMILAAVVAAKLVISTANGVAVTDYTSMERCEAARADLIAKWMKKAEHDVPGYHVVSLGVSAYCISA